MLDELVPNRYKVSNNPHLTGWNTLMSIHNILDQLMARYYGMPDVMVLFNNHLLSCSSFPPTEAPKMLSY
jgi:hypothetical protein